MFRVRRFGVIRTANVAALLYVVMVAIIFVPMTVIVALVAPRSGMVGNAGAVAMLLLGVVAALFYGLIGWVFTAIACLLYNFVAGLTGGIEIQIEAVQPPAPAPVWGAPPPAPPSPLPPAGPPEAGTPVD